jgi:hypothetical protein
VFGTMVTCALLHALITDTMLAGFGFSFGVLQDYYSSHAPFAGSNGIAVIGTLTTVSPVTRVAVATSNLNVRVSCSLGHLWYLHFVASILTGRAGSPPWDFLCASSRS